MGILANTVSICHFRVQGETPQSEIFADVHELLRKHAFVSIDEGIEELSIGWVHTDDPKERSFADPSTCWLDHYLTFSMRRDQRKVPAALLKEHIDKAAEEWLSENTGYSRVPKAIREDLKEVVRQHLLAKSLPDPKVYDVVWDTQNNLVVFTTLSSKTIEVFEDLFKRTFEGLRLVPFIPYHRAMHCVDENRALLLAQANQAGGDNYLELTKANRWLGADFMLWLLFETLNGDSEYWVNQPGPELQESKFVGYIDDRLVLAIEVEGGTQTITVNGPQDRFSEVRAALHGRKQIAEATIHLETGDNKWCLTLKGENFHFASFTSPAVKVEKDNTTDEQVEREAVFFERMLLLEKGLQLFDSLFTHFLNVRLGYDWGEASQSIAAWISEE